MWREELDSMVTRVNSLRTAMAEADSKLGFVASQQGMFSLLPLQPAQVTSLIDDHGVYLAGDGRINVAGCQMSQINQFTAALEAVGFNGADN